MICVKCKSKMILDDVDRHFNGCVDNYYVCNSCLTSCIEHIRYNTPFQESWHSENDGKVEDFYVLYPLKAKKP